VTVDNRRQRRFHRVDVEDAIDSQRDRFVEGGIGLLTHGGGSDHFALRLRRWRQSTNIARTERVVFYGNLIHVELIA
jgi:hypothetical protein